MVAHLKGFPLTTPYMPERLEVLPAMPSTPSGKIQQFRRRDPLKAQLTQRPKNHLWHP